MGGFATHIHIRVYSAGKKQAISHLLSKIKESGTLFNTDKLLIKTFFDKLKNSDKDADDILYKLIITKSIDESKK